MSMDFLYGVLVIVAFVFFASTLAVVSEQTERHLKRHDKDRPAS